MERPASTLAKLERMRKALRHEEPDRVPISDFFWGGFLSRWRRELDLPPDYWREYFKPWVKAMVDHCHAHGLPVIYHGCGNVKAIFEDFIEIGIDACNPLEAKAGMDVIELWRQYGHRMAFCGNLDVRNWERGKPRDIRAEILRKLNAAQGGGLIFQSDHSVTSAVSGRTYDYVVELIREHGVYPLDLGESDGPVEMES